MIKKLELCLQAVLILLNILNLGSSKLVYSKSVYLCRKQSVSTQPADHYSIETLWHKNKAVSMLLLIGLFSLIRGFIFFLPKLLVSLFLKTWILPKLFPSLEGVRFSLGSGEIWEDWLITWLSPLIELSPFADRKYIWMNDLCINILWSAHIFC